MTNAKNDADDRLLLSKAYDAIELSERRNIPRFLGFLNEHESMYLMSHLPKRAYIRFYGGYDGAVRLMLGAGADDDSFPVTALEFTYKPEYELRHRDFLGALTALGIRRDTVGDILTSPGRTVVFVRDDIAPFILSNADTVGRVGVKTGYADTSDLPVPDDTEELTFTLSSLRLDVFVARAANLSRDKAAVLIHTDMVAVDHVTVNDTAARLREGAVVTIRRYGKFVLTGSLGESRKGKLRIAVTHYK